MSTPLLYKFIRPKGGITIKLCQNIQIFIKTLETSMPQKRLIFKVRELFYPELFTTVDLA